MMSAPSVFSVTAELGIPSPLPDTVSDRVREQPLSPTCTPVAVNDEHVPLNDFSLTVASFLPPHDAPQQTEHKDAITRAEFSSPPSQPRPHSGRKEQFVSHQPMPLPSKPPLLQEDSNSKTGKKSVTLAPARHTTSKTLELDSSGKGLIRRSSTDSDRFNRTTSDEDLNNFVFHRLGSNVQGFSEGKAFGGKLIFPLLRLTEQSTPVLDIASGIDQRFVARSSSEASHVMDPDPARARRPSTAEGPDTTKPIRRTLSGFARSKKGAADGTASEAAGDGSFAARRKNNPFATKNDDDDDEEEEDWGAETSKRSMMSLYLHVGFVIAMAVYDVVALLALQLFWVPGHCLCSGSHPNTKVRKANAVVLALILLAHVGYLLSRMLQTDTTGKRIMFRIFHSSKTTTRVLASVNIMYVTVVGASVVLLALSAAMCTRRQEDDSGYAITRRLHLATHLARLLFCAHNVIYLGSDLRRRLQTIVSVNKRRFVDAELSLDLDLTYIADRLIAFALPCVENAFYRNDIRQVARFFSTRHYGSFVVTNLCEAFEEGGNGNYDTALLYSQVQKLPMRDHNAPDLLVLVSFCEKAASWLNSRRKNVVAVHCQGGKGRTGTFCAALMLWVGFMSTAEEAAEYFARRRTKPVGPTDPLEGINAPCQHRYLKYIETMMYQGVDVYARHSVLLHSVTINTMPHYNRERVLLSVVVETAQGKVWDSAKEDGPYSWLGEKEEETVTIKVGPLYVQDDVTVRIFLLPDSDIALGAAGVVGPGGKTIKYNGVKGKCISFVTVNTAFHARDYLLVKREIDEAYKDRRHRLFSPDYSILLGITDCSFAEACRLDGLQVHRKADSAGRPPSPGRNAFPRQKTPSLAGIHGNSGKGGRNMFKAFSASFTTLSDSLNSLGSNAQKLGAEKPSPAPSESSLSDASKEQGLPLSRHGSRVTALPDQGIIPGLTSGLRELALTEAFGELLAKVCPETAEFHKGEVILDVRDRHNPPLLMYVVEGQVSCVSLWDRRALGHCALGMHRDQRDNEVIGVGELFAVRETTVRNARNTHQVVYRAKSRVVKLRVLRAGILAPDDTRPKTLKTVRGPFEYPCISSLSATEKCVVYEFIARYATNLTHRLAKMQLDVTTVVQSKHDRKAASDKLDFKQKLVASAIARHKLPVFEMAIASQECTGIDKGKKTDGHLILLNHWLIFVPLVSTGQRDVLVPLQDIVETDGNREHFFVQTKESGEHNRSSASLDHIGSDFGHSFYNTARKGMTLLRGGLNLSNTDVTTPGGVDSKHSSCGLSNSGDTDSVRSLDGGPLSWKEGHPLEHRGSEYSAAGLGSIGGAAGASLDSVSANEAYRVRNERKRRKSLAPEPPESGGSNAGAPQPITPTQHHHQHHHSHRSSDAGWGDGGSNRNSVAGGGEGGSPMTGVDDGRRKLHFVLKSNGLGHLMRSTVRMQVALVEEESSNIDTFQTDLEGIIAHYGYLIPEDASLGDSELSCLKRMLSEDKRKFKAGDVICKKGDDIHTYMHILEGMLTVREDDGTVLAIRTKGDSVLESNFLAAGNHGSRAKVVAETNLVVQCLSFDKVEKMAHQVPMVGACVFRALGWSLLKRSHRQTVQLLAGEQHIVVGGGTESEHHRTQGIETAPAGFLPAVSGGDA